jgi:hypothetical protein
MFAASVLLQATVDLMREVGDRPVDTLAFAAELTMFTNIVGLVTRCQHLARMAKVGRPGSLDDALEIVLHPATFVFRMRVVRLYLVEALAAYLGGEAGANVELRRVVSNALDEVNHSFEGVFGDIEKALTETTRFALTARATHEDWRMLEAFRQELTTDQAWFLRAKAERFCALAESLAADGKLLRALRQAVTDPAVPVTPDLAGDLVYVVPWVKGPGEMDCPFGLDTRHGHVVFVFLGKDELYNKFFEASADRLKEGFELVTITIVVPRELLATELRKRMPAIPFGISVQGTPGFERLMQELAQGMIWPEAEPPRETGA